MADPTEITFTGDWRISVRSRDAGWQQRVIITGSAGGMHILAGVPGAAIDITANGQAPWTLAIEHNDGTHGWQPNFIRSLSALAGPRFSWSIESEDDTSATSDRDFNDLVIDLGKLGLVGQPTPPMAILPNTLQAMPEGVFEATLGRYLMSVRIQNIWTLTWPPSARVGLSDRCRAWLAAAGVTVVDPWSQADQDAVGQQVVGGRVVVGALGAWETRRIYFKVDVANAQIRKHQVELQVMTDQGAEDVALINKSARAPIFVTRTTFDPARNAFVSRCDVGTMTASINQLTIDLSTFKRALVVLRKLRPGSTSGNGTSANPGGGGTGCDFRTLDFIRAELRAFLDGKSVDLCALWRLLACCCASHCGGNDGGGGNWTDPFPPGLTFFAFPTDIAYAVDYAQPFTGQFGPIPFQDPWWKLLLIIIAIILTIAAAISGGADVINQSDNAVIGTVTRAVLNAQQTSPAADPPATDTGSVDVAIITLNGHRGLTSNIFTVLDAAADEASTIPIDTLGGHIDTPGTFLTNAQIITIFQNLADNPTDPAAQDAVRVFKSGSRSGTTSGLLSSGVVPISPRGPEEDGSTVFFLNQIRIVPDATGGALSCAGDSGSLWFQTTSRAAIGLNHAGPVDGSFAVACRIEDVLATMGIRFA